MPMTKPTIPTSRRGLSRRQLLKAAGGTAALLAAARLNFPAGAFAQGAGPAVTKAMLGFIALSDAGQAQDAEHDPESDPSGRAGAEPAAASDDRASREEEEQIADEARAHWPLLSVLMSVCIWCDVRV